MTEHSLWYIVTPVFKPAPGGGAIYTDILARALAANGADVVVETEAFPGEPRTEEWPLGRGSIKLDRLYPLRAGRAERDWRSYLAYAAQNLKMLGMPRRLGRAVKDRAYDDVIVLVHSSLLYNRGVLPSVLRRLRRAYPAATLIVDVRDPTFDAAVASGFTSFDAAVGCSHAVAQKLRNMLPDDVPVAHIPMPFESPSIPSDDEIDSVLAKHGLGRGRYLFNPNGLSAGKHYPVMREAIAELRRQERFQDLVLATAGRARDRTSADDEAEALGLCRYIGIVEHRESLALMRGAMLTLVLSKQESISRAALEAMAIGGRVILPDVTEFRNDCAGYVCAEITPQAVAAKISAIASAPLPPFDLGPHSPAQFLPLYLELACSESSRRGIQGRTDWNSSARQEERGDRASRREWLGAER